jgi:hypothetical protein
MLDLHFEVSGARPVCLAVAPTLLFQLRITQRTVAVPIQCIQLRCQVRIEPAQRRYRSEEQEKLRDLFDTPDRWGKTLRPLLWTHTGALVGPFTEATEVDLPVPCTFDFHVAATKYFSALEGGEVPLNFLFSGTIFYATEAAGLQVAQVPWDREATFRLPVRVWQEMMDLYYPNCAWLCLRRDVFDQLHQYKVRRGLATWEEALEGLLSLAERQGRP